MARIGVFVCHCGSNIANTVDVEQVADIAAQAPDVVFSTDYMFMCSEPGQNLIQEAIREHNLDRVVVAACSPTMHFRTFSGAIQRAGLNPYMLEMANIREQCSWVHTDKAVGTDKSADIVTMAVGKTRWFEPLFPQEIGVTRRALVIGGGIAGIQAALDIADSGVEVVLVERSPSIGGKMAQLDKTFPTLDCSGCILTPRMTEVVQHPNITLHTWSEVQEVRGFVGNFEVDILHKPRYVDATQCTGCGECLARCPWKKIPSEFDEGMGTRPAIYRPFPQAVPNVPVIDAEHCVAIKSLVEDPEREKPKCGVCLTFCPRDAIDFRQQPTVTTEEFGAIVLANGFSLFDASVYGEYGYGRYPDVITSIQMERLMNAAGPTDGEIRRPSDGKHPRSVVFLACVGSRDERVGRPYCSKICCMYSAKHAIMLKEHDPDVQSYVLYMDVRAGGKGYEEFIRRAQEEYGACYLRGRVSRIYPEGDHLVVMGEDTLMGMPVRIEADLVVLATGVQPQPDASNMARILGISYDSYGFINESHPKLNPVESNTAGIFLAGSTVGPKDIPESVSQASAAAAKVLGLLSKPSLLGEAMTALVDRSRCAGCFACEAICPYQAIERVTLGYGRQAAEVNEGLCKGCGLCTSACLGKVITLRGFSDQALLEELNVLLLEPEFA
ncbi:MAG: CoB--CoM heterodisulfide reductase iron-sulfur subunit A family protein [Ardenticatenia bacterium]|nr:CoB--CoM heterodisulfide reductase iron-sulfur subunit A family protein [Ardenticatenia bacterium]